MKLQLATMQGHDHLKEVGIADPAPAKPRGRNLNAQSTFNQSVLPPQSLPPQASHHQTPSQTQTQTQRPGLLLSSKIPTLGLILLKLLITQTLIRL